MFCTSLLAHVICYTYDFNSSPLDKMAAILAGDSFKYIFLNENELMSIQISLKFVPIVPIDNKSALVQVMAWRRTGDKPLSEAMMTQFTDAYMRHQGEMSFKKILSYLIACYILELWSGGWKIYTMAWNRRRKSWSKSPGSYIQIEAPHHWPFVMRITGDPWIPLEKGH